MDFLYKNIKFTRVNVAFNAFSVLELLVISGALTCVSCDLWSNIGLNMRFLANIDFKIYILFFYIYFLPTPTVV